REVARARRQIQRDRHVRHGARAQNRPVYRGQARMKVVDSCYGGAHSSQVAAAIHLGRFPGHRPPTAEELLSLPRFDRVSDDHQGIAEFVGTDEDGHEVYVLGRGPAAEAVERAFRSGYRIAGGDDRQLLFVNALQTVNLPMRVGGYLSRRLGWVAVGRPLVVFGTRRAFPAL